MHGSYDFASGISHADWIYCPCFIMDGDDVAKNEAGAPEVRAMWIPADQAQVVDTWSVVGMRGTGSHDFIVEDVFVPESHTCFVGEAAQEKGPLYDRRMVVTSIFVMLAGTPLGIARGAINELIELATDRTTSGSSTLLRDRPAVQAKVGETEAILSSARAYVLSTAGAAWMAACDGKEDPSREIAGARLAVTYAIHEAVRAVDMVFHAAGTNAFYTKNSIERHFRDIHVVAQHNAAFLSTYEAAGKVFMGLRPTELGW